jgi:uncharacterized membrane protein SirB2
MQQTYVALLPAHMLLALLSPALLSLRVWRGRGSAPPAAPWQRWLQAAIDALLLLSGLALGWIIQQFPFADSWLTAKLLALVAYVAAAQLALWPRGGARRRWRAWLIALALAAYLFAVALTQSPLAGLR